MRKAVNWETRAPTVLVVEDDVQVRFAICSGLRQLGFAILEAESCAAAVRAFEARPDVVVMDLRLPDGDALDLLPRLRGADPNLPVFIVTGYGTIDIAVRAVKQGAEDFLTKPVDVAALGAFVRTAVDRKRGRRSGRRAKPACTDPNEASPAPRSDAMKRVEEQLEKLRDADCSVLILGETGTGKSVLARRIHAVGARSGAPMVDINCAGLTKEFVESELFGHERGAFTGAHAAKQGLFDVASGGTLFLDEIGDIDIQVQPKLLKVIEEKRFRRMGDVRERSVDVRLVAATHHDLLAAITQRRFRADLYYRISTVSITLPALRERREDLMTLARQLLDGLGAPGVELAQDAKAALVDHSWPGNLRELKNVLERALLMRSGDTIRASALHFDTPSVRAMPIVAAAQSATPPGVSSSGRTLSELEREHITSALAAEHGRVEAAAKRLGIPRSTLYQRIKDYGLRPSQLRKAPLSDPPDSTKTA